MGPIYQTTNIPRNILCMANPQDNLQSLLSGKGRTYAYKADTDCKTPFFFAIDTPDKTSALALSFFRKTRNRLAQLRTLFYSFGNYEFLDSYFYATSAL
jgi:hypothetical protein